MIKNTIIAVTVIMFILSLTYGVNAAKEATYVLPDDVIAVDKPILPDGYKDWDKVIGAVKLSDGREYFVRGYHNQFVNAEYVFISRFVTIFKLDGKTIMIMSIETQGYWASTVGSLYLLDKEQWKEYKIKNVSDFENAVQDIIPGFRKNLGIKDEDLK